MARTLANDGVVDIPLADHDQAIIHSSKEPNYRTPIDLYQALDTEFHFCIDLAAVKANALAIRPAKKGGGSVPCYIGPDHELPECRDALHIGFPLLSSVLAQWQALPAPLAGFCNPPYSRKRERELKKAGDTIGARAMNVGNWAERFWEESLRGLTIVGLFPYARQTVWFRRYVLGITDQGEWAGHAAMEVRTIPHRISFAPPVGQEDLVLDNAGVNHCVIVWRPPCGYVGPWTPVDRLWDYFA